MSSEYNTGRLDFDSDPESMDYALSRLCPQLGGEERAQALEYLRANFETPIGEIAVRLRYNYYRSIQNIPGLLDRINYLNSIKSDLNDVITVLEDSKAWEEERILAIAAGKLAYGGDCPNPKDIENMRTVVSSLIRAIQQEFSVFESRRVAPTEELVQLTSHLGLDETRLREVLLLLYFSHPYVGLFGNQVAGRLSPNWDSRRTTEEENLAQRTDLHYCRLASDQLTSLTTRNQATQDAIAVLQVFIKKLEYYLGGEIGYSPIITE